MSLPEQFNSYESYFDACTQFFEEYQNLYNFANTDVLVKGIIDDIRIDNFKDVDVFEHNFELRSEGENIKLFNDFFNKLDKLKVKYNNIEIDTEYKINAPLGPKKKHEIICLAKEIGTLCNNIGCDTVVDFGSGLGYLDQVIFDTTHYNVLGLECNERHYVGAKKRQNKYHIDSTSCVKFIRHRITEHSHVNLSEFLNDKFQNCNSFCITGLHACADLTVDAMNIFLKMENARAMILMPCCYHKMRIENLSDGKFSNFPLSKCLKEIYIKNRGFEYMKVPFLRLAAQPQLSSQSNIKDLVFNLLARAVLQIYACKYNYTIKRKKRKAVRVKTIHDNFESYAQDACTEGFLFVQENLEIDNLIESNFNNKSFDAKVAVEELNSIWNDLPPETFKKAATFILLQNQLQPIIENFILLDRIVYLKENGLLNTTCRKIVNANISPRCLALFAHK
ncbi:Uncharacterized protein C12orf26-like [Papilio xuthus]|uniref:Uncharacterized protein C12orf26-like n=1 Tax=Papilio xuthus TaxID=66420 RepID=A0A194PUN9_PAPXU|nr:Uncharacterized protein C12orf26-like [Papilio xuthus]